MFREKIGLFILEPSAKLYAPKNSGLHEYVNDLLHEIGVSERGEFTRTDDSVGTLELIPARGEDVPQRVDDCLRRGEGRHPQLQRRLTFLHLQVHIGSCEGSLRYQRLGCSHSQSARREFRPSLGDLASAFSVRHIGRSIP